jgi:hypothetical protein
MLVATRAKATVQVTHWRREPDRKGATVQPLLVQR